MNWRQTRVLAGVRNIISTALEEGISPVDCLSGSAITEEDLNAENVLIQAWQEMVVVRNLVRISGRPGLGFSTGIRYHVTSIGVLGLAMLACETLSDAFDLNNKFPNLTLTFCPLRFTSEKHGVWLEFDDSVLTQDTRQYVIERSLSGYIQVCSELLQRPINPLQIEIKSPSPENLEQYYNSFPHNVIFSKSRNALLFSNEDFFARLPQADADTRLICEKLCTKLCVELSLPLVTSPLSRKVQLLLMNGDAYDMTCFDVAQKLGYSERTLHRYIQEEGQTFKSLSDGARRIASEKLLKDTDLDLDTIAAKMKYSSSTSFSRAFKRWTGLYPTQWARLHDGGELFDIVGKSWWDGQKEQSR